MNEDWAQIAIRFNLLSSETVTPVRNVLTVSGAATAAGNVTFNMTNAAGTVAAVVVPIAAGDNAQAIAGKIAARISAVAGFAATEHSHLAQRIVLVNPRQNVDFDAIVSPEAAVVVQEPALDFTDEINLLEGNVLGLNFDDGNDSSIDMIAVGQIDMRLNPGDSAARAVTGNDASAATLAGWQNLSILTENAVNRINDATVNPTGDDARLPFTAGHEMGHAIFDGGNGIHHPTATNLFTGGGTSTADTIGASKRLDDPQNTRGRDRSGPATVPPLLQQR
jgi:hypothetical protein